METSIEITEMLLLRSYFAIQCLKEYIDQVHPDTPLLWQADKKTPVKKMKDYLEAEVTMAELRDILVRIESPGFKGK